MDQNAFDRIAKVLGGAASRRSGLIAALGAAVGRVAGPSAAEAGAGKARERAHGPSVARPCGPSPRDNKCTKDAKCCTGYCKPGKKGKAGRCRCAPKNYACTAKSKCCDGLACTNGKCKPASPPPPPVGCDVCMNGCAYTSVEAAYAAASDGDTILIDAGLYPTAIDLDKSITLQACRENGGLVILQYKDSTTAILTDPDTTAITVTLKGLDFAESGVGSGKTLISGKTKVSWTVTECNFLNAGSGLNITGTGATSVTVTDCTFDNISSPISVQSADLTITGSTFTHARAAVSVTDDVITPAGLSVTDSTFSLNVKGISYMGAGTVTVTGCTIKDNSGPALDFLGGTVTISGCTITGNTVASDGGAGGRFTDAAVTINTTTISGNTAGDFGGGLAVIAAGFSGASLLLDYGNLVTGNTAPEASGIAGVALPGSGTLAITGTNSSNVTGNLTGDQCETGLTFTGPWTPAAGCVFP